MGCIRVDKITEYLCEPLRKCLKDEDPYVRKTAAVCVAKLYDISPSMVCDYNFFVLVVVVLSQFYLFRLKIKDFWISLKIYYRIQIQWLLQMLLQLSVKLMKRVNRDNHLLVSFFLLFNLISLDYVRGEGTHCNKKRL